MQLNPTPFRAKFVIANALLNSMISEVKCPTSYISRVLNALTLGTNTKRFATDAISDGLATSFGGSGRLLKQLQNFCIQCFYKRGGRFLKHYQRGH